VLTVGGWFDAEDCFGALATYRAFERQSPGAENMLVMGPWRHGGWARNDGKEKLECLLTLRKGEVVWDRHGLTCPPWQEAAPDSGYWEVTEVPVPVPRLWRKG